MFVRTWWNRLSEKERFGFVPLIGLWPFFVLYIAWVFSPFCSADPQNTCGMASLQRSAGVLICGAILSFVLAAVFRRYGPGDSD